MIFDVANGTGFDKVSDFGGGIDVAGGTTNLPLLSTNTPMSKFDFRVFGRRRSSKSSIYSGIG